MFRDIGNRGQPGFNDGKFPRTKLDIRQEIESGVTKVYCRPLVFMLDAQTVGGLSRARTQPNVWQHFQTKRSVPSSVTLSLCRKGDVVDTCPLRERFAPIPSSCQCDGKEDRARHDRRDGPRTTRAANMNQLRRSNNNDHATYGHEHKNPSREVWFRPFNEGIAVSETI